MLDKLSREAVRAGGRGHGGRAWHRGWRRPRSCVPATPTEADTGKILNYNPDMEYRSWARPA